MSEIEVSSGNIYTDIGVENADEMLVKAQLAASIQEILDSRNLTQTQAAEVLGLPQPRLSRMLHVSYNFHHAQTTLTLSPARCSSNVWLPVRN